MIVHVIVGVFLESIKHSSANPESGNLSGNILKAAGITLVFVVIGIALLSLQMITTGGSDALKSLFVFSTILSRYDPDQLWVSLDSSNSMEKLLLHESVN